MANQRMFLKCKKCEGMIYLAKYYPNTGWYISHSSMTTLDEAFKAHEKCSSFELTNEQFEVVYE